MEVVDLPNGRGDIDLAEIGEVDIQHDRVINVRRVLSRQIEAPIAAGAMRS